MSSENVDQGVENVTASLVDPQVNVDPEAAARARDHGWIEQNAYDYKRYNATVKDPDTPAEGPIWAVNAKKYEWKDEYGDVGPEDPVLEIDLFGSEHTMRKGEDFET